MENVKLDVTLDEAKFLIQVLNKQQFSGVETAKAVLNLAEKLSKPIKAAMDKEKKSQEKTEVKS